MTINVARSGVRSSARRSPELGLRGDGMSPLRTTLTTRRERHAARTASATNWEQAIVLTAGSATDAAQGRSRYVLQVVYARHAGQHRGGATVQVRFCVYGVNDVDVLSPHEPCERHNGSHRTRNVSHATGLEDPRRRSCLTNFGDEWSVFKNCHTWCERRAIE